MKEALLAGMGGALAGLLFGLLGSISFGLACRFHRDQRVSVRWATTLAIALWLAVTIFWVLAPWGLFRWQVLLPSLLGLFILTLAISDESGDLLAKARTDLAAAASFLRTQSRGPGGWPLVLLAMVAGARLLRGSGSPPLGWDSITYHLLRAGRWVQDGALVSEIAPDAWSYYEYYPVTGDIVWAWAFLPISGDGLLTLAGWAVWAAAVLAVYASARALDARPRNALYAACAVGAMPSTLTFLSSGYVDNLTLATFLLASLFVIRLLRGGPRREAILAAAMLGLMVGVKTTTAPFLLIGGLVVLRAVAASKRRKILGLACLLVVLSGSPGYFRAWVEKGSPTYPFGLQFGGKTFLEGNEEARLVASGQTLAKEHDLDSPAEAISYFLFRRTREGAFVNPGPGAPIILLLGLIGSILLLRQKGKRLATLYLLVCAAILVGLYFSGYMVLARTTIKATTVGRYLTPIFGAAAVLGSTLAGRWTGPAWSVAILLGAIWSRPVAWTAVEAPMMMLMVLLAMLAALGAIGLRSLRAKRALAIVALLGAMLLSAGLDRIRSAFRYPLWAMASHPQQPLFHMHRLHPLYTGAWPLWQHFDQGRSHRLAVTGGWDGLGHNWYRYPLLGSRFQNEVVYVPITADGSVVDYRRDDAMRAGADLPAWLMRLHDREIDHVVSLSPRNTLEDYWLRNLPEIFPLEFEDPAALHAAFRVDQEALRKLLPSLPGARISSEAQESPDREGEPFGSDGH